MEREIAGQRKEIMAKHPILSLFGVTRMLELILDQVHCGLSHFISTSIKRVNYCPRRSYQQEFQQKLMGMGAEESRTFIFPMGNLLLTPKNKMSIWTPLREGINI